MKRREIAVLAVIACILLAFGSVGAAASFPETGITLVIPWSAGGVTDRVGRVFAALWEKELKQSVTVLNKGGASGAIGTDYVNTKPADGYTVLMSAETPGTFQVMNLSKLSFDDFEPIMMMVQDTKILVVPAKSPYNTVEDLIKAIKAAPGKVKMSYSGPGASGHIQGLLLKKAGLDISMTPFGGGSESLLATISGQVDFTFANTVTIVDYVKTGQLKALATFAPATSPLFPKATPLAEALPSIKPYMTIGFPNSLWVRKGTPASIKKVLLDTARAATKTTDWLDFTNSNDYVRMHDLTADEMIAYWKNWTSQVSWLLYEAGATAVSPEAFKIAKP